MVNTIRIENEYSILDLNLRGGVVLIRGNSATGKSLAVSMIRDAKSSAKATRYFRDKLYKDIEIFNYNRDTLDQIKQMKGKLIIIDNADEILNKRQDILEFINNDCKNQYIIIGRCIDNLKITPNYIGRIQIRDMGDKKIIELVYDYTEESWW